MFCYCFEQKNEQTFVYRIQSAMLFLLIIYIDMSYGEGIVFFF